MILRICYHVCIISNISIYNVVYKTNKTIIKKTWQDSDLKTYSYEHYTIVHNSIKNMLSCLYNL